MSLILKKKMKTIYGVKNRQGLITYIGATKNVKQREYQYRCYNIEVSHLEVLENVDSKDVNNRINYWIEQKLKEGHPLKNKENKHRDHINKPINLPENIKQEVIKSAEKDMRSVEDQMMWLITLGLKYRKTQEDENV